MSEELIDFGSSDDDDLLFLEDDISIDSGNKERWKVLIVDDEPMIHQVTSLALQNFEFEGKKLKLISAHSGAEARDILNQESGIALILLDVVMETDDAGLRLVNFIRYELKDQLVRIVLRTGQPGVAPEKEVITKYDIDDYKAKTELTVDKLYTTVHTALRSFNEVIKIDRIVQERTKQIISLNHEIQQSIAYANRIQTALLPTHNYINEYLPNCYILYRPCQVVSGDFYWFDRIENFSILAIMDCTGHGVPGAFMTIFAYNILNQVIKGSKITEPNLILQSVDYLIRERLKQNQNSDIGGLKESMDIVIMKFDHVTRNLTYSSAKRPLFMIRDNQLVEFQYDKYPVGDASFSEKSFSQSTIPLKTNDRFYVFTDGFTDQFGGDKNRKFSIKRLKELLINSSELSIPEQHIKIYEEFEYWKRDFQQIDDVCFVSLEWK